MQTYDAVIAGGGVMGMASAYSLLKRGVRRVLVVEKASVGNDRAASTDETKAIRFEYAEDEVYSRMVGRSIELWRDLEGAAGAELYVNCGVVCWGRGEDSFAERSYRTLRRLGLPIEEVDPSQLQARFPQFNPAEMSYATHNPEGGFLRASRCVRALSSEVTRLGAEIREGAGLAYLKESDGGVELTLEDGTELQASRVVLAVGAWGANLFERLGVPLPVKAHKQQVVYVAGLGEEYSPARFPVFLNLDHDFYGFPLDSNGLLKTSVHETGPEMDPDVPEPPDEAATAQILALLGKYIPGAARGRFTLARTCMYAMTPDEDFLIDNLPGHERVVVAAGFSGHGFKFAPVVGELVSAIALGEAPAFSLDKFSILRFSPTPPVGF